MRRNPIRSTRLSIFLFSRQRIGFEVKVVLDDGGAGVNDLVLGIEQAEEVFAVFTALVTKRAHAGAGNRRALIGACFDGPVPLVNFLAQPFSQLLPREL